MIGSSHLQLWKKNVYSVELQDGSFEHSPRKVTVEDQIDESKTQRINTPESKERKF